MYSAGIGPRKPGRRQVILSCEHIDGSPPIATGLLQELRSRGFNTQWTPFATWISERSIVFSGRNNEGWSLWRQELDDRFSPVGDAEQLTTGTTLDWWPSFATGRLVFVSSHPDINLWSLPADTRTGAVTGVLRRITRGPGITAYPSLSADGRALAFASDRGGNWDIIVKATETGTERVLADGADRQMYASITRDGRRVSYGVVVSQPAVNRPIYVADVAGGGPARLLCKDCNGRPRDWFPDGQHLLIERYGRRNSVAVLDDTTGTQRDLVISDERSVIRASLQTEGGLRSLPADVTAARPFTSRRFLRPARSPNPLGWKLIARGIIPLVTRRPIGLFRFWIRVWITVYSRAPVRSWIRSCRARCRRSVSA